MQTSQNIILIGLGKVGREVIRQLQALGLEDRITGLADSSAVIFGNPLPPKQINEALLMKEAGQPLAAMPGAQPLSKLSDSFQTDALIVDTSAARDLDWKIARQNGCQLVFANKNAHSSSWMAASLLFDNPEVRYEATVGAGLPVIKTLRNQVATGDGITRIEGVMSGTLGFLCSRLEAGVSYSQAVREAFEQGFTEPDPRDDLSGFDVLRKAIILGRTAGWPLESVDFTVQPLYDDRLINIPVAEFFQRSTLLDPTYAALVEEAARAGKVLRYLATVTPQGGQIGLQAVKKQSELGALQGPGNYFAFYSRYYDPLPLVISGPGAGIQVTANGVLGDIIALMDC